MTGMTGMNQMTVMTRMTGTTGTTTKDDLDYQDDWYELDDCDGWMTDEWDYCGDKDD